MSACLYLLGVSSPFSAPQQLSMSAAVADWGRLLLCKAAALLVLERGSGATFQLRPTRQEETSGDWEGLCDTAPCHVALFLLVVFLQYRHAFVRLVCGREAGVTFLSHHATLCMCCACVSYVYTWITGKRYACSLKHPGVQPACIWPFCMYETVFDL